MNEQMNNMSPHNESQYRKWLINEEHFKQSAEEWHILFVSHSVK